MKKEYSRSINVYSVTVKYYIDVIETYDTYEAWLHGEGEDSGIKNLLFGVPKSQFSYEEFLDIVEDNLRQNSSYIFEQ